ncbi:MAG: hypothetical protein JXX14_09270 [Deltaproteobacteria bacterium]|nr:hypothetical protein [Deltaproteobacteria bacterium]
MQTKLTLLLFAVFFIVFFIASCGATQTSNTASSSGTGAAPVSDSANTEKPDFASMPVEKRIYYFEHQFLPALTYTTDGAFLDDLLAGELGALMASATEMVSAEYAAGISVKVIDPEGAALLSFANPQNPPDCYFVFVSGKGDNAMHMTYEKAEDFTGEGVVGMVGMWTPMGDHANMGPRNYTDADSFVKDAKEILGN